MAWLYRLSPDRRFLMAGAFLRTARGLGVRTKLRFEGGVWTIAYGTEAAGSLPEYATFSDALAWLRNQSKAGDSKGIVSRPAADLGGLESEVAAFSESRLIGALDRIDALWDASAPDPRIARLAGRSLTLLVLQGIDRLELADEISARALAALALAEVPGTSQILSDEALLADLLGYTQDAKRLARELAPGAPVRLYIERDVAALQKLAASRPEDRLVGYLAVRVTPGRGHIQEWKTWVGQHFTFGEDALATLHAELAINAFETREATIQAILAEWMRRLGAKGRSDEPARDFEAQLANRKTAFKGPFWDDAADTAWARASFYSALDALGDHYLEALASRQATASFLQSLEGVSSGPGAELARWYSDMSDWTQGFGRRDYLLDDALTLHLGTSSASKAFQRVLTAVDHDQIVLQRSRFAACLDSRPDARIRMITPLWSYQTDPSRLARVCRECLDLSGSSDRIFHATWCASILGEKQRLLATASDPTQGLETRSMSLNMLVERRKIPPEVVVPVFRDLLETSGYERIAVSCYITYLDQGTDDAEQLRVAEAFLEHHPSHDFAHMIYVGRKAHFLSRLGRDEEAWRTIEPEIAGMQGAVMGWGAEILQKLGRSEEALALARKAAARYPDSAGDQSGVARQLWSMGRYADAAAALADPRYARDAGVWGNEFAEAFAGVFLSRPLDASVQAVDALIARGVWPWMVMNLVEKIDEKGNHELAFHLQERLVPRAGPEAYEHSRLQAYRFLRSWKGEAAAAEWMNSHYDETARVKDFQNWYAHGFHELLWSLLMPERTKVPDRVWLLRAAGAAKDGLSVSPNREALLEHFRDLKSADGFEVALGRYLVGLDTAEGLVPLAKSPAMQDQLAYFWGVRAFGEGRYDEAGDWFSFVTLRRAGSSELLSAADAMLAATSDKIREGIPMTPSLKRASARTVSSR